MSQNEKVLDQPKPAAIYQHVGQGLRQGCSYDLVAKAPACVRDPATGRMVEAFCSVWTERITNHPYVVVYTDETPDWDKGSSHIIVYNDGKARATVPPARC